MIEFKALNRKQLQAYVDSEEYYLERHQAITKHRALSYLLNPEGDEKDIVMILAYKNGKLIGYRGILPGLIFYSDGTSERFGWFSTIWIDPAFRGLGIGKQLVKMALDLWDGKIVTTYLNKFSYSLHSKTGYFDELCSSSGLRIFLRSNLTKLRPSKFPNLKKAAFLFRLIDRTCNSLISLLQPNLKAGNFEHVENIDSEAEAFIIEHSKDNIFKRTARELNWIINNKWIISSEQVNKKYHFSSHAKSFNYYCIKVRDNENKLVGFLMFSKRDGSVKLPYCYFHPHFFNQVIDTINYHLIKWRTDEFTTYHASLVDYYLRPGSLGLFKKRIKRPYLFSKYFKEKLSGMSPKLQDGDGDYVFT